MRSYGQYCSLARSLDLVGDRWTLLIVRELLILGACRYSDLQRGLPGIATNLLAGRLREMSDTGIVERRTGPGPAGTVTVELTERGRDLAGVVRELTRWGAPEMARPGVDDQFRTHWLMIPARHFLTDRAPDAPAVTVRLGDLPDALDVHAGSGRVDVVLGDPRTAPDATVTGPPPVLVAVITGRMAPATGERAGLTVDGRRAALHRILPGSTS